MNVGIPAPSPEAVDTGPSVDAGDAGGQPRSYGPRPPSRSTRSPPDGFIADNVTVTMGEVLPLTRPYFFPLGSQVPFDHSQNTAQVGPDDIQGNPPMPAAGSVDLNDVNHAPVLTIPQDIEVYAPPNTVTQQNVQRFEDRFPHLVLNAGVPAGEAAGYAVGPAAAPPASARRSRDVLGLAERGPRPGEPALGAAGHPRGQPGSPALAPRRAHEAGRRSRPHPRPGESAAAGQADEHRGRSRRRAPGHHPARRERRGHHERALALRHDPARGPGDVRPERPAQRWPSSTSSPCSCGPTSSASTTSSTTRSRTSEEPSSRRTSPV